jgi:hypothetical protein
MLLDAVLLMRLQFFWVKLGVSRQRAGERVPLMLQQGERARGSVPPSEVSR